MKRNLPFFIAVLTLLFSALGISAQSGQDKDIATLNSELGKVYLKSQYDEAMSLAKQVVELVKKRYPGDDLGLARALKNRGFVENAKGDSKEAAKTLEVAAEIFKKHPDLSKVDGSSYASTLEALAAIKRGPKGEELLELALKWRERSSGPDSRETATTLARLANFKFWNRDYKTASEMYRRALFTTAKTTKDLTDDNLAVILERTRCSYRKAKLEGLDNVESEYKNIIDSLPDDVIRAPMLSGGVLNGKALFLARPVYSVEAKQNRASGSVSVQILINEKGEILSACAVSGNSYLAESSEIAALQSKFSPTLLQGHPVKVSGVITYNYVL